MIWLLDNPAYRLLLCRATNADASERIAVLENRARRQR